MSTPPAAPVLPSLRRTAATAALAAHVAVGVAGADVGACGHEYPVPTPATNTVTPPVRRDVPGVRVQLEHAVLYWPDYLIPDSPLNLIVFLHGAAWVVEQEMYQANLGAALITVNGDDLASRFATAGAFTDLLATVGDTVAARAGYPIALGRVCLASFSGGSTAVRAILDQDDSLAAITDLLLADSLYGPKSAADPAQMDSTAMEPFLRFARLAAAGQRTFWFTQLYPPDPQYRTNTTSLAASYLIERLGLTREPCEEPNERDLCVLYRADRSGCHIRGYAGMSNQDHVDHLYTIGLLLGRTSLSQTPD